MKKISLLSLAFLFVTTMADAAIITMTCQANDGRTRYTSTAVEQGGCESLTFETAKKACFEKLTDSSMYSLTDYTVKNVEVNGTFNKIYCK